MKKKVLLMGASGSGKTSMRSVIFSNHPASLTSRLGATIDVEQNHVRFLGDLVLNLWDCGGQDSFMESYAGPQSATTFQEVGVLIYVFDIESRDVEKDLGYYRDCLDGLRRHSPDAAVFLLVHKVDLVRGSKKNVLRKKKKELREASGDKPITLFGTSIYDESLYKAWSRIVHTLIPNAAILSKHLTTFAEACSATEVILFERATFLVIATSQRTATPAPNSAYASSDSNGHGDGKYDSEDEDEDDSAQPADVHGMVPTRYERTSELIKAFKRACTLIREDFHCLEMELPEYTAVLDELTKSTYVMVVVHDPTIETAAIKINIRLARQKFEELQADSIN